jgi:predicted DNA-binding transcriptional regulator YafY
VALQAAVSTGAGIEEAALRALTTVRQVMPSRLRHRLDALRFTPVPRGSAPVQADTAVLVAVSAAVRAREVLRFDYAARDGSRDESRPPRRVEPHDLVVSAGRWYVVAWDLEREDWRVFRADRMVPRVPTGPRFVPRAVPGGDAAAYVAARFKGSDRADTWPCTGTVVLDLPVDAVRPFAGDGTVEPHGDDRCRLTSGSWSWVALAASFGRFDADLEVVGPPPLREAFEVLARRAAAALGPG